MFTKSPYDSRSGSKCNFESGFVFNSPEQEPGIMSSESMDAGQGAVEMQEWPPEPASKRR